MRMRAVHLFLFVIAVSFSAKTLALTIDSIPHLIRENSHDVKAAVADIEAADYSISAARAKHYPSLSSRTTFVHLGSPIVLQGPSHTFSGDLGSITISLPPIQLDKQDAFFSSLIVKFPIFAGGRISAGVSAAEAQKSGAEAQRLLTEEEKTKEALERYFQVLLARQTIAILEKLQEQLDRIAKMAESLVRTGVGTKFAVLQIQVNQKEVEAKLTQAKAKANLAEIAFKTAVGYPLTTSLSFESPLVKLPLPARADEFKSNALSQRKELGLLKAKGEQVQALKDAKTGELLPTLYAVGGHRVATSNSALLEPNWAVGVVMEIPLTGFLESLPERQMAIELQNKVEALEQKARLEIPLQVEKIYTEALAAEQSFNSLSQAESLALEALRLAEVRFKNASGSAVEVLKASADLERAQVQSLLLKEEFNRNLIALYAASGNVKDYLSAYKTYSGKP